MGQIFIRAAKYILDGQKLLRSIEEQGKLVTKCVGIKEEVCFAE